MPALLPTDEPSNDERRFRPLKIGELEFRRNPCSGNREASKFLKASLTPEETDTLSKVGFMKYLDDLAAEWTREIQAFIEQTKTSAYAMPDTLFPGGNGDE